MSKIESLLTRAEDLIYIIAGLILVCAAITLLGYSGYDFISASEVHFSKRISRLLDDLLLVLMLVEILHTIGIFLKQHKLIIEPFLAIGIIAAIRRILIITAEQVHPTPAHASAFHMTMLELGLLSGMILALVLCIFLLRRHGRDSPVELEE